MYHSAFCFQTHMTGNWRHFFTVLWRGCINTITGSAAAANSNLPGWRY